MFAYGAGALGWEGYVASDVKQFRCQYYHIGIALVGDALPSWIRAISRPPS
jgi:hypothetical protein